MMLAAEELRVALATTHLPPTERCRRHPPALLHSDFILHHDLRTKFVSCYAEPRILVLWPESHAGEGGHMGTEEDRHLGTRRGCWAQG